MHKIWLIIKREYLTKVRKKTFIIATILFPILYLALMLGSGYIASRSGKKQQIAVIDSSGYFSQQKLDRENVIDSSSILRIVNIHPDTLKQTLDKSEYDGFVVIPAISRWENGLKDLPLQTNRTMSIESSYSIQRKFNNIWNNFKNEKLGIDEERKKEIEASTVTLSPTNIRDKNANSEIASRIGIIAAILIYIILMLYGSQVMMGVMEEKTNRIAEVIVSSVKPFQLMLGKIIGIGLVAFTQILIWISFILIIYNLTSFVGNAGPMGNVIGGIQQVFTSTNVPLIFTMFTFYLMGGFFFYSSMFAAMGSAVNEDMREAQSLSFPLMMPIIFSIALIGPVLKDPTGPVAFWGSMIPFSSPIIMMARIPFGVPGTVPLWQLGLSMTFLIAGFVFTTWFAGKIYRTGILMYGKKPSWKEMMKWAFRKN